MQGHNFYEYESACIQCSKGTILHNFSRFGLRLFTSILYAVASSSFEVDRMLLGPLKLVVDYSRSTLTWPPYLIANDEELIVDRL